MALATLSPWSPCSICLSLTFDPGGNNEGGWAGWEKLWSLNPSGDEHLLLPACQPSSFPNSLLLCAPLALHLHLGVPGLCCDFGSRFPGADACYQLLSAVGLGFSPPLAQGRFQGWIRPTCLSLSPGCLPFAHTSEGLPPLLKPPSSKNCGKWRFYQPSILKTKTALSGDIGSLMFS